MRKPLYCLAACMVSLGFAAPLHAAVSVQRASFQDGLFRQEKCEKSFPDRAYNDCYCKANIHHPLFSGFANEAAQSALNDSVKRSAEEARCPGKAAIAVPDNELSNESQADFQVTFKNDALLALALSHYVYSGGAHGMSAQTGMIVELAPRAGQVLTVSDLLDAERLEDLNEHILDYLKDKRKDDIFTGDALPKTFVKDGACDGCTFILEPQGLTLRFQPYAVGPYSSGFIDVPVPKKYIAHAGVKAVYGK